MRELPVCPECGCCSLSMEPLTGNWRCIGDCWENGHTVADCRLEDTPDAD
jgi:hypothetical protein